MLWALCIGTVILGQDIDVRPGYRFLLDVVDQPARHSLLPGLVKRQVPSLTHLPLPDRLLTATLTRKLVHEISEADHEADHEACSRCDLVHFHHEAIPPDILASSIEVKFCFVIVVQLSRV